MWRIVIGMLAVVMLLGAPAARADLTDCGSIERYQQQAVYKVLDNALLTPCPWSTSVEMCCPLEISPPDGCDLPYVLDSAALFVIADGVDGDDHVLVKMEANDGWRTLGYLNQIEDGNTILPRKGPGGWCENFITETWFDLDPEWFADGDEFKLKVEGFRFLIPNSVVEIEKVGLRCSYAPIPAPGAGLLGAMGLAMVHWVKRRP